MTATDGELLLIAPALNSRLRHWVSDPDEAVRQAHVARLEEAVQALAEARTGGSWRSAGPNRDVI